MGEEAKPEQAKGEEKKEEKAEEKKEEPKPPSPVVLSIDLHCVGCAKKIEKSILRINGVEGVVIDMTKNEVTIKGAVEPQDVCNKVMKKTKRRAQILSPIPAPESEPVPEAGPPEENGSKTIELTINMHCEACAKQLKRKILKMQGVTTVQTELSSGKVTVTGTMDGERLVEYVYSRTKKQAKIVPQPEPEKPKEEAKPEENKESAEKPSEEEKSKEEEKKEENGGEKPPEEQKADEGDNVGKDGGGENKEPVAESKTDVVVGEAMSIYDEQRMQRMMYYYQPLYVTERIPPAPQLFSDENPNACCIT